MISHSMHVIKNNLKYMFMWSWYYF